MAYNIAIVDIGREPCLRRLWEDGCEIASHLVWWYIALVMQAWYFGQPQRASPRKQSSVLVVVEGHWPSG